MATVPSKDVILLSQDKRKLKVPGVFPKVLLKVPLKHLGKHSANGLSVNSNGGILDQKLFDDFLHFEARAPRSFEKKSSKWHDKIYLYQRDYTVKFFDVKQHADKISSYFSLTYTKVLSKPLRSGLLLYCG